MRFKHAETMEMMGGNNRNFGDMTKTRNMLASAAMLQTTMPGTAYSTSQTLNLPQDTAYSTSKVNNFMSSPRHSEYVHSPRNSVLYSSPQSALALDYKKIPIEIEIETKKMDKHFAKSPMRPPSKFPDI